MKIREVMTNPVIRIRPEEPVAVAARTLARYAAATAGCAAW